MFVDGLGSDDYAISSDVPADQRDDTWHVAFDDNLGFALHTPVRLKAPVSMDVEGRECQLQKRIESL